MPPEDKAHKPPRGSDPAAAKRTTAALDDCVDFASLSASGPSIISDGHEIEVVTGNTVTEKIPGSDKTKTVVRIWSPAVVGSAEISLKSDVDPDPAQLDFGWVQTIESSQRVALYESAKTKVRASFMLPNPIRDVRPTKTSDGKTNAAVPAPWYYPPEPLTAAKRHAYVEMKDQPKVEAPPQISQNNELLDLVGLEGGESFTSSLKIGTGANLKLLKSYTWAVPWAIDMRGRGVHTGGEVATGTTTKDGQSKNDKDSPDAVFDNDKNKGVLPSYTTVAEAEVGLKARVTFLEHLALAKRIDSKVYWNMVGALWKSPLAIRLKITGVDAKEWPPIQVTFRGPGGAVGLPQGAPPSGWEALGHMVYAPDQLDDGKTIDVVINGQVAKSWAYPFKFDEGKFSGQYKEGGTHLWHSEKSYSFELDFG